MRITNLTTAVIESNFDWAIVKVETDAGVCGYGELFPGPGTTAVVREFFSILEGEDATHIDRLHRRMKAACVHASPGVAWNAIAGIEAAVLDAVGKRYGLPIWQILGGKYRDEVTIYADCHSGDALSSITPLIVPRIPAWMRTEPDSGHKSKVSLKHHGWDATGREALTPESYGARAAAMVEKGFRVLKFDVDVPMPYETDEYNRDLSRLEIDHAEALVSGVRKAVGRGVGLAIDCHWNYGVQAAVELCRALEPHKLLWLEDPTPPDNIRAIGEVQRNTATPVSTGENHYFRLDFQRLITEAGLRVLAPDAQKLGLWEGRRMADMCDLHYVNLTWHNISGPLGTMAGAHLAAAVPNLLALEWHAASIPFFDSLVKNSDGPMVRNGKVRVSDRPGLGIELDEAEAYKYAKPGEKFFE